MVLLSTWWCVATLAEFLSGDTRAKTTTLSTVCQLNGKNSLSDWDAIAIGQRKVKQLQCIGEP